MSYFSKRALRWAAPVALVGALGLAACGGSGDSEPVRVAAPSGVNAWLSEQAIERVAQLDNDQHLNNKAAELAQEQEAFRAAADAGSDQHLNNQAAEIASQRANRAASARLTGLAEQMQSAQAARLAAQAEQYERSAHLEGQANTYSGGAVPTNSDANLPNAFEAGNRAAQLALAEGYVEQQQDRAESNSSGYDDEFLPGSRHVPTR
jgi:hypothetical protein